MAPWGLCLCEGLWCPSMSECLPASLVLVGGLSVFFQREEGLSLLLPGQGEVRYVHNDSSHIPPGTPSTQHTGILLLFARRNPSFAGSKRQWFPPWHSQPAVMLAMGMDVHPQGQGFVTDLHWSRICFIPPLIFFCVAEDTAFQIYRGLRPERFPSLLGSTSAFPSLFKAPLGLKTCSVSTTQGTSCSSRSY